MEQTPVEFIVEQLDCLNRERKENLIDAETYFKHKAALIKEAKAREKQKISNAYDCTNSMAMDGNEYYNEIFKSE
jgi:hypothetical protein